MTKERVSKSLLEPLGGILRLLSDAKINSIIIGGISASLIGKPNSNIITIRVKNLTGRVNNTPSS